MLYIREFEITAPDENGLMAVVPFGMDGATQGEGLEDALEMAADWLYHTILHELIAGNEISEATFGNKPNHNGQVVVVAVDVDLCRADAMTAADAARALGVSSARVAQMCDSGQLVSWRDGTKRMVLRDSVNARIAEQPKAGRPKKTAQAV